MYQNGNDNNYSVKLIDRLIEEASLLKNCVTNFSFQTMAICVVVLGLMLRYQFSTNGTVYVGFAGSGIVLLALAVMRIGIHKNEAANRALGYELHINRIKNFPEKAKDGWQGYMVRIGWQEAMRAWRVVQPTIFNHLYEKSRCWNFKPKTLKKEYSSQEKHKWYLPESIISKGAKYKSGSYFHRIFILLTVIACVFLGLQGIMCYQVCTSPDVKATLFVKIFSIIFTLIICALLINRYLNIKRSKENLEYELLSIHSCAILWQAVVVAHYRATEKCRKQRGGTLKNYTFYLSEDANILKEFIFDIHQWIENPARFEKKYNS